MLPQEKQPRNTKSKTSITRLWFFPKITSSRNFNFSDLVAFALVCEELFKTSIFGKVLNLLPMKSFIQVQSENYKYLMIYAHSSSAQKFFPDKESVQAKQFLETTQQLLSINCFSRLKLSFQVLFKQS